MLIGRALDLIIFGAEPVVLHGVQLGLDCAA